MYTAWLPVKAKYQHCRQRSNSRQWHYKKYDVITIGQFKLKLTEVNWNNTTLSGKGKIIQSWFKVPILVEFTDLKNQ